MNGVGGNSSTVGSPGLDYLMGGGGPENLERAARVHRNGTALYDASCTWSGQESNFF